MQIHSTPIGQYSNLYGSQQGLRVGSGVPNETAPNSAVQPVDAAEKVSTRNSLYESSKQTEVTRSTEAEAVEQDVRAEKTQAKEEEKAQQLVEQKEIARLSARDREVRAHEQAHVAAGGKYAGAAKYQYERGPNGVNYAVAGEVSISVGKESSPEETVRKAQIVRRAALAPAEPSSQDRRVAAQATQLEAQARQELAEEKRLESQEQAEEIRDKQELKEAEQEVSEKQESQDRLFESQSEKISSDPRDVESISESSSLKNIAEKQAAESPNRLALERSYNIEPVARRINIVA